jgi:hypothetical protein
VSSLYEVDGIVCSFTLISFLTNSLKNVCLLYRKTQMEKVDIFLFLSTNNISFILIYDMITRSYYLYPYTDSIMVQILTSTLFIYRFYFCNSRGEIHIHIMLIHLTRISCFVQYPHFNIEFNKPHI